MTDSQVLGVILLARHGDRLGFYQDPETYIASATAITALGNQQEFGLGAQIRSLYMNASSPSYIQGISTGLFNQSQVHVRADAGGEAGVIFDSAISLVQGLWPATTNYNTTLANGTTIVGPLGGYQYVPIESVEPTNDVSLEGYTSCEPFDTATTAFYNSTAFLRKQDESAAFLKQLPPYLDGRPVTLQDMWNIYDFINVQSIHNATFAKALPATFLAQARDLANWHEYGVFTSPELNGIGNIAGRTILPSIIDGLTRISNSTDPLKFLYEAIAYKPFLSLFNMTGVAQANPELAGIVNYAAAVALEVRQPSSGGSPVLRFNFQNGSDAEFRTYNLLGGSGDIPLSTFVNTLTPVAVSTTAEWCSVCSNTQDRGCGAIAAAAASARAEYQSHQLIGPVGTGFLGAGVTLAVAAAALALLTFLGFLTLGKQQKSNGQTSETESIDKA
jgi:hypothetical protein